MKQLSLKLIFPLSIISLVLFTKWWHVIIVDGPDVVMYGFPLPYIAPALHTSMAFKFFALEFIVDLVCYFMFWFLLVYCIFRFVGPFRVNKVLGILLQCIAGILVAGALWFACLPDNSIKIRRDYEIQQILDKGYKFT